MSNFESHHESHPKSKVENPLFEDGAKHPSIENIPNSSAQIAWTAPEEIRGKAGPKPDGLPPVGNENYYTEHDAKTLSNLGEYALEHSNDRSAINAFQQELLEIRSHGQDYTKQVFNQVKADQNSLTNNYASDDRLCFNANIFAVGYDAYFRAGTGVNKSVCGFSDGNVAGFDSSENLFHLDPKSNFHLFEAPPTKKIDII